ncbi:hypothetical protein [Nocardia sp. NPDC050710]|uniref:hypothetical protein n=1 Tax=Nocardia sp. NPDC050710 TaxID=3157220 RepID=UPI0033E9F784
MSTDDADTNEDAETEKDAALEDTAATDDAVTGEKSAADAKTAKVDMGKATKDQSRTESEKSTEADESEKKPTASGESKSLPLVAAFVAGVLLVGAITAVVVFFLQAKNRGEELDAIHESTAAACAFGKDVSVYDYSRNLDEYFTKVKAGATGEFRKEFEDASKALTDAMVQAQVKSWVDDVQCGYQSGDETSAKVLVTLTQYRTNFTQTTPDRQFVVVIADLEKSDGKWLVSKLDSPMLKGGTGLPGGAPAPATPAPTGARPAPGN